MTRDVVEAYPEMPFKDVVGLLDVHRISGLPVVDDDKVVGVISRTDLTRRRAARSPDGRVRGFRIRPLGRSARRADAPARTGLARELMSTPAITVHPEQRIADAARVMERHGVERLPVVDEEDRLIGIATRRDLLRVFLRTDDEIRRELHDEVLPRVLGRPDHGVAVSVHDGMATLEGALEHSGDLPLVIRLTYRVEGVVGVVNRLTVRAASGPVGPAKGPTGPGAEHR
ncbi:CBS domain-containing protein [Streptomyces sp. ADMS]|uniref:CBS domain-containing protein n=1 Tax=Streptomyces sp. ADMS TaxID=3071415 RepID=UPI00296E61F0|nr:CBS domain-containing protein [Streptomyces sp. ADMS]MDW4910738.1 CBS domain-containing protein [Streptomyces sp. ADMS]